MVEPEIISAVQQLEDIFIVVETNLRAWPNILGLGAKDVSAGRCKWEVYCCTVFMIYACLYNLPPIPVFTRSKA